MTSEHTVILLTYNLQQKALRNLPFHIPSGFLSLRFDYHYDPYPAPLNFVQSEAERIQPDFNFVFAVGKAGEIS